MFLLVCHPELSGNFYRVPAQTLTVHTQFYYQLALATLLGHLVAEIRNQC